ncbi:hypothetical protein Sjap_015332 [Stephania japonica]|uniref:Uncharacterized protein n=1 Tax=Stephania japonica TaxID=461633 RepID=A0AAP0IJP7_9MAGN
MCGGPVVLNMLADAPPDQFEPLNHPVHFLTGGSTLPASVLQWVELMDFIVTHEYGLTETGRIVVYCTLKCEWDELPANERAKLKARKGVRTIGMADVDVVNPESGHNVKRDGLTLSEIVLRRGRVMLGYLMDLASTARSMSQLGWFYTGDLGAMHPDGYLEIKGRSKDVINSGGEKVSSVEVESVLYSHPLVYEAAVVARPDEFLDETPCAFVSLKAESDRVKEIVEYCKERMPHYMAPKSETDANGRMETVWKGHSKIYQQDIVDVLDKQLLEGMGVLLTEEEQQKCEESVPFEKKRLLAVHEAGHILLAHLFPQFDWHAFSQFLPGGKETAISVFYPREDTVDQGYTTFGYLKMQMVVAHGGRCAERIVFGDDFTDGGRDNLEKITKWDDPRVIPANMTVEVSELFTRELTKRSDLCFFFIDPCASIVDLLFSYTTSTNLHTRTSSA